MQNDGPKVSHEVDTIAPHVQCQREERKARGRLRLDEADVEGAGVGGVEWQTLIA